MTPLPPKSKPPIDPLAKKEYSNEAKPQMEKTKKRHNPPILEEDLAMQAFDETDVVQPRPDFDTAKESAHKDLEFKIEEGYRALERKFEDLVLEVYGSEIRVCHYSSGNYTCEVKERKNYNASCSWYLFTVEIKKRRILPNKKIPRLQSVILKDVDNTYSQIYGSESEPKFNPIAIKTYNQDALEKAKLFAQKYKEMSGQNVRLIQEF